MRLLDEGCSGDSATAWIVGPVGGHGAATTTRGCRRPADSELVWLMEVFAGGIWRDLGGRGTTSGHRGRWASPQLSERSLRRWGSRRRHHRQAWVRGIPPAQATFAPSARGFSVLKFGEDGFGSV